MSEADIAPAARLSDPPKGADRNVALLGSVTGFGAVLSAAACCVLPLALGAVGLGAGGLAVFVPLHWPLTMAAAIAVTTGWFFYLRRRRGSCAEASDCSIAPSSRATFAMLCLATTFVTLSVLWSLIETPLLLLLGGA